MVCKKCDHLLDVQTITLLGNYVANLCIDCRNEWNQFIMATEEYKHRNALEISLRIAIQGKYCTEALGLNIRILENQSKLFKLAQKWCEGKETK